MQFHPFVEEVQAQLTAAAALGDDRAREVAAALVRASEPAIRLAVLGATSAAADEITAALLDTPAAPTVTVHTDGDDLRIDVRTADATEAAAAPPPGEDTDANARISLRLSESLKSDIEVAARAAGVSVNTWLVRAAVAALATATTRTAASRTEFRTGPGGAHRITGWING